MGATGKVVGSIIIAALGFWTFNLVTANPNQVPSQSQSTQSEQLQSRSLAGLATLLKFMKEGFGAFLITFGVLTILAIAGFNPTKYLPGVKEAEAHRQEMNQMQNAAN